jgi:hypothetical protein
VVRATKQEPTAEDAEVRRGSKRKNKVLLPPRTSAPSAVELFSATIRASSRIGCAKPAQAQSRRAAWDKWRRASRRAVCPTFVGQSDRRWISGVLCRAYVHPRSSSLAKSHWSRVGRSSDSRALKRLAFSSKDSDESPRQWLFDTALDFHSVTAAGPSRSCTGVPCFVEVFAENPDHQRTLCPRNVAVPTSPVKQIVRGDREPLFWNFSPVVGSRRAGIYNKSLRQAVPSFTPFSNEP